MRRSQSPSFENDSPPSEAYGSSPTLYSFNPHSLSFPQSYWTGESPENFDVHSIRIDTTAISQPAMQTPYTHSPSYTDHQWTQAPMTPVSASNNTSAGPSGQYLTELYSPDGFPRLRLSSSVSPTGSSELITSSYGGSPPTTPSSAQLTFTNSPGSSPVMAVSSTVSTFTKYTRACLKPCYS